MQKQTNKNLPDVAIYDLDPNYHYSTYWQGRAYEHYAEIYAIRYLLKYIKQPFDNAILDVGAGFGRLYPSYCNKFKTIVLGDYSIKELLDSKNYINRYKCRNRKKPCVYKLALNAYFLPFKDNVFDSIISVRVIHHIEQPRYFLQELARVIKPGGYMILEVANKDNLKALFRNLFKFDFKAIKSKRIKIKHNAKSAQGLLHEDQGYLFFNYKIKYIIKLAQKSGLQVVTIRQVSILRHPFIKKIFPTFLLRLFEGIYQNTSIILNKLGLFLTPSVFILFKKIDNKKVENVLNCFNLDEFLICPKHHIPLVKQGDKYVCSKGCVFSIKQDIKDLRFG